MFGSARPMLGANHIKIRADGVTRIGRIEGKIKEGLDREGDILIVVPWSFRTRSAISSTDTRPRWSGSEEPVSLIPILNIFVVIDPGRAKVLGSVQKGVRCSGISIVYLL